MESRQTAYRHDRIDELLFDIESSLTKMRRSSDVLAESSAAAATITWIGLLADHVGHSQPQSHSVFSSCSNSASRGTVLGSPSKRCSSSSSSNLSALIFPSRLWDAVGPVFFSLAVSFVLQPSNSASNSSSSVGNNHGWIDLERIRKRWCRDSPLHVSSSGPS